MKLSQIKTLLSLRESHSSNLIISSTEFISPVHNFYKFTKRGAVTRGIYKVIRHPQYVALAIMGLGLLMVWPRFTVLIMFVSMLFVYYWLASKEEQECEEKFGKSYLAYKAETSMFIPGKFSLKFRVFPEAGVKRFAFGLGFYFMILSVSVGAAFELQAYSISRLAVHYSENSATISADFLSEKEVKTILEIALADPGVQGRLHEVLGSTAARNQLGDSPSLLLILFLSHFLF